MSDAQTAAPPPPAAGTQEAAPTPAAPQPSKYERGLAAFKSAAAPPQPAKPPPAAPPAPDPKPAEDLDRARQQQALLQRQRDTMDAKKRADTAEAKLLELEVFTGEDRGAVLKALKAKGITLQDLAKAELDAPDDDGPPTEAPEVKALRERIEAFERKEQEAQASAMHAQNLDFVSKQISADATGLPLLQSYGIASEKILELCQKHYAETGESPDVAEIAAGFHANVMADLDRILETDSALDAWLSRPEVKARALKVLRAKEPSAGPASDEGASERRNDAQPANSSTAAAGSALRQAEPATTKDRYAAALDALKKRTGAK